MKEKSYNLLLVDDHQLVIDGIKSMLSGKLAFQVIGQANNGKAALELINSNPTNFDLVITDISMPILNGIQLCSEIKSLYPTIKVIVLSMHNDLATIKESIAAEADGYMLKNIEQKEFLNGIDRVLDEGTYFSQDILPMVLSQVENKNEVDIKSFLTSREFEVLTLIMKELTSKEIAEKLFISKQTVDTHRMNIMQKTGCKTLVGLIKLAIIHKM